MNRTKKEEKICNVFEKEKCKIEKRKKKCVVDLCTATPRDPERERERERGGGDVCAHESYGHLMNSGKVN